MSKVSTKLTKTLCVVMCVIMSITMLTACKTETIDGKWDLTKQVMADGTVKKGDDLAAAETYVIKQGIASYTCEGKSDDFSNVGFQLTVVDKGNNTYDFMASETYCLCTAEIKGKYLVYTVGEGDEAITFYFAKEKSANTLKG